MELSKTTGSDANVLHARVAESAPPVGPGATDGAIGELTETLQHVMEAGRSRLTTWRRDLQDGIGGRPIQAVLIAAGVGAVLGLVMGLRSR